MPRSFIGIDFGDAALCAIAAEALANHRFHAFGDALEGLIVVPLAGHAP